MQRPLPLYQLNNRNFFEQRKAGLKNQLHTETSLYNESWP
jgi:hypothetical protein